MWNDLQIEQWPEDDNMRKTRVQNDQFWDQLDYNVDQYVKDEGAKATPHKQNSFKLENRDEENKSPPLLRGDSEFNREARQEANGRSPDAE